MSFRSDNSDFILGPFKKFKKSPLPSNNRADIHVGHGNSTASKSAVLSINLPAKQNAFEQKLNRFPKNTTIDQKIKFIEQFLNISKEESRLCFYPDFSLSQLEASSEHKDLINQFYKIIVNNKENQFFIRLYWKTPDNSLNDYSPKDFLRLNFSIPNLSFVVGLVAKSYGK